jgi:hypothetical protein
MHLRLGWVTATFVQKFLRINKLEQADSQLSNEHQRTWQMNLSCKFFAYPSSRIDARHWLSG